MKKLLIISVVFIFVFQHAVGQGELDEQQRIFFRNERTFAVYFATDGWGFSYRYGKRLNYLNKRIFDFDLGVIKHPKEVRLSNPYYPSSGSFVFGKENCPIFIRGGIGHQHELFTKADLGGISIRYFISAGPALALYKPIYYTILVYSSPTEYLITEEKFDIKKHDPTMINGRASVFKGLDETKVLPGLYAKGGFNFEYSKEDKVIHAIEIGAQINLFPKEIPIMATETNKAVYFSLFASYRFGVVIDRLNPESNSVSNIFGKKRE
jgi:hypothetical protein